MENYEQPVGKQWGWYSSASGIWQTVFVEPRAPQFIERFEITTDIDRAVGELPNFLQRRLNRLDWCYKPECRTIHCSTVPMKTGVAEAELNVGKSDAVGHKSAAALLCSVSLARRRDRRCRSRVFRNAQPFGGKRGRLHCAWNAVLEWGPHLPARRALPVLLSRRDLHRGRYADPPR